MSENVPEHNDLLTTLWTTKSKCQVVKIAPTYPQDAHRFLHQLLTEVTVTAPSGEKLAALLIVRAGSFLIVLSEHTASPLKESSEQRSGSAAGPTQR